jgi:protein farnesyltransferase/geranylgeranyltransferase type-1 subunit alpha
MDEIAARYLKTYQVWHHRRLLLMALRSAAIAEADTTDNKDSSESSPAAKRAQEAAERELPFIERILNEDAKNYHTWAHRQWLLAYFNDDGLWAGEMDYVERLLGEDVRNNSVWHHRFFVVFQSGVRVGDENREAVLKREIA